MRLGCPNCGALYDVADGAIPAAGRDVQCSACHHHWFQPPRPQVPEPLASRLEPQASARQSAADPASGTLTPAAAHHAAEPAAHQPARPRPADPAVMQILREEAARELAARRRESAQAGALEPAPSGPASAAETRPPRRTLLPEIDEVDPSLRTQGAQPADATIVHRSPERAARGGFAAGFALSLTLVVFAAAAYVWSAELAAAVPALEDPLARYVAAVDEVRLAIRSATR